MIPPPSPTQFHSVPTLARKLRNRYQTLYSAHPNPDALLARFSWDLWHQKYQFYHLRSPAIRFFGERLSQELHHQLRTIALTEYGIPDISPPWLSLYMPGHYQNWHRDEPHGPWAYVFPLTPSPLKFRGGETCIKSPRLTLTPRFGRLLLFDGSLLHRVSQVSGASVESPLDGRLVLHGWFLRPRPFIDPYHPTPDWLYELQHGLSRDLQNHLRLHPTGIHLPSLHGTLVLKVKPTHSGHLQWLYTFPHHLRDRRGPISPAALRRLYQSISILLSGTQVQRLRAKEKTSVWCLPFQWL